MIGSKDGESSYLQDSTECMRSFPLVTLNLLDCFVGVALCLFESVVDRVVCETRRNGFLGTSNLNFRVFVY